MKIIAHGVKDAKAARKAISHGVDFVEIDVSKRFLFNKFTSQHNGLMGLFGFGPLLEKILTAEFRARAFLDLKPVSPRASFAFKLSELIVKMKLEDPKICGHNWAMISALAYQNNAKPFYTLKNQRSINKFRRMIKNLKKPAGFSVHHDLINEKFMQEFKKKSVEIWTFTVNDIQEAKRLTELKVDGIITDKWENLLSLVRHH